MAGKTLHLVTESGAVPLEAPEHWYRVVNRERVKLYFAWSEGDEFSPLDRAHDALMGERINSKHKLEQVQRPAKLLPAYVGSSGVQVYIEGAL